MPFFSDLSRDRTEHWEMFPDGDFDCSRSQPCLRASKDRQLQLRHITGNRPRRPQGRQEAAASSKTNRRRLFPAGMECPHPKSHPLFISTLGDPILRSCGTRTNNLALGCRAESGLICASGGQRRIAAGSAMGLLGREEQTVHPPPV